MAFRQYRHASSGIDAGVQALLYGLTIVTAPVWVPVVIVIILYQSCTANSPAAVAERARIEATQQAERAEEQTRLRAATEAAAHAPWDRLRCDALLVRLDQAVRSARAGSDNASKHRRCANRRAITDVRRSRTHPIDDNDPVHVHVNTSLWS